MARKPKTAPAPQLPLEPTQEQREFAEGYAAVLRLIYSKPWDGMTRESLLEDADAFEADFDRFPEEKRRTYAAAIEDARRYIGYARSAAARGDVPTAWEWLCSVVRVRRFMRGEVR